MNEIDDNERKRAWEYYQHADNIHSGRINFFLVAESMLVVSFVSTMQIILLQRYIAILGFVYTFCWWLINSRLTKRMKFLNERYLESLDNIYDDYMKVAPLKTTSVILSYILPLSTLIFWIFLFGYTIK